MLQRYTSYSIDALHTWFLLLSMGCISVVLLFYIRPFTRFWATRTRPGRLVLLVAHLVPKVQEEADDATLHLQNVGEKVLEVNYLNLI